MNPQLDSRAESRAEHESPWIKCLKNFAIPDTLDRASFLHFVKNDENAKTLLVELDAAKVAGYITNMAVSKTFLGKFNFWVKFDMARVTPSKIKEIGDYLHRKYGYARQDYKNVGAMDIFVKCIYPAHGVCNHFGNTRVK